MNQIFGYQILNEDDSYNNIVFKGTKCVLPSIDYDSTSPQVKIFAHSNSSLQSYYSYKHKVYSYVWGIPSHPKIAMSDIPEWCAKVADEKRYELFRELVGSFAVIIDDPIQHRITFVTDILGVRPMFLGNYKGRLVFGSSVWPMYEEGLSSGEINYDAVSSLIAYGYNCTGGSLFSDLNKIPPGTAVIFQEGQYTEASYTIINPNSEKPDAGKIAKDLHDIISATVKTLMANFNHVSLSLSGGFDSRYLLALILSLGKASIDCATVNFTEAEGQIASEVAKTFNVPLKTCKIRGSVWDMYEQVYHFTPDGFPITKNVNYCVAEEFPGIPMVNGFLGGILIRGVCDSIMGKYEDEWKGDLADVLQERYLFTSLKMFRKDIAERIKMRSRLPMEDAVRKGSQLGKIFFWTNIYYNQRYYISNNFLQHIAITEALLPFYSWELLLYKMSHDDRLFNRDVFLRIFKDNFPKLGRIPHADDLKSKKTKLFGVAQCTRKWANEIFPLICSKDWLSLLQRKHSMMRNVAGITGLRKAEASIFILERLYLLEKKARETGLNFDWDSI